MLRAPVERGINADFVVGPSVGAINAVQFAADPTPEGVERLERIWRTVRRQQVFPVSPLGALLRLLTQRGHLATQTALRRLLERHLTVRHLEDTVLPCHVITTDLLGGTEVRLSAGPAVEALLASTAIPGIFQPVRHAGRHLADGTLTSNTPTSTPTHPAPSPLISLPPAITS